MNSLADDYRAIIIGATGGIGSAFVEHLEQDPRCAEVIGLSRSSEPAIDFEESATIQQAAEALKAHAPFHLIIDATGVLHDEDTHLSPEKALKHIEPEAMLHSYLINTVGPALLLKHFHPLLPREGKSVFASLSAKVGSIGDNQIGGWHSYRCAKAALNMLMKNTAIELNRKWKEALILGLHPGTVDTGLSQPFSGNISHEIFSPAQATGYLLEAMDRADMSRSGCLLSYDGKVLPY